MKVYFYVYSYKLSQRLFTSMAPGNSTFPLHVEGTAAIFMLRSTSYTSASKLLFRSISI